MRPDERVSILDQAQAPDPKAAYRLYRFGLGGLIGLCAWFLFQSGGDVGLPTLWGLAILVLSFLPALRWARQARTWFPAFEISLLTCVAFYAIPILTNHTELSSYRESIVSEASGAVLIYLAMANLGFSSVRTKARTPRWSEVSLLPQNAHRYVPVGMALNTIYLFIQTFTTLIPPDLDGALRALFFGVGIVCTFILARSWGLQVLSQGKIGFFVVNLILQILFVFAQLYLITGLSLMALGFIAYTAARRRVPWVVIAIVIPLLALLHLGKPEMREKYWEKHHPLPTMLELPAFFAEWIGYSFDARAKENESAKSRTSIFERASLIQMLCLSVDRVPEQKPYLLGQSYVDIPAQIIPRIVWPDKPSSLLANVRLALYFNLVSVESAFSVSIAFGMIAEAYVNFGHFGVAIFGLVFGAAFKHISLLAQNVPQFSALGILMILLTAWSFQAELVLATWLASLFQAAVVCIGMPLVYRRFTTG